MCVDGSRSSHEIADMRIHGQSRRRRGITIWECLLVLGVVGVFATILVTGARRAPVVDAARQMKDELEEIDRVTREAQETGEAPASGVWRPGDYLPRVRRKFTRLREEGTDPFGNAWVAFPVDGRPVVPQATARELDGVIDPAFWSPFQVEPPSPSPSSSPGR